MINKKAFTLAETLIVLVILGVVAAITIPALIRRQVESSNRTRIRKAITVYDTAINKMVVENGIKSNDALINEFNADRNNGSCEKSRVYFKVSQVGANDCTFRASDGVWWNISDINHPIIAFNEDDLTDEIASGDTNRAFHLVGYLDDNGSLRVGDLAIAEGDNEEYLKKLYNFANKEKVKLDPFNTECENSNQIAYCNNCKSCTLVCPYWGCIYTYDENGKIIAGSLYCNDKHDNDGCYELTVKYDKDGNYEYIIINQIGNDVLYGTGATGISPGWMLNETYYEGMFMADCTESECKKCYGDIEKCKSIGFTNCNNSTVYLGNAEYKGSDWGLYVRGSGPVGNNYTGQICTK